MDTIFDSHPGAKRRLLRAAVATLHAQGRSVRDFDRLSFSRSGDRLSVLGDGQPIISLDVAALLARHDA